MATVQKLVQVFNEGQLGDLLVKEFNGEIGHRYPMRDADSIISFESDEATPSACEIRGAVISYYRGLGFTVTIGEMDCRNSVVLIVRCSSTSLEWALVIITVPFPHDGNRRNLRMTCEIHV